MSSVKTPMTREEGNETHKAKETDIRERRRVGMLGRKAAVEGEQLLEFLTSSRLI